MAVIIKRLCCLEFLRPAFHFSLFYSFFCIRNYPFLTDWLIYLCFAFKRNKIKTTEQIMFDDCLQGTTRCGSRIWSRGGAPASEAESCRRSEAESPERSEHSVAGVQGPLKGPGSFWVFDAQICILTHSRDSFSLICDIYFDTKS